MAMDFTDVPAVDDNFPAEVGHGSWVWTGKTWRRGFTPPPLELISLVPDTMFFGVNFNQPVQVNGTGFWPSSKVYMDDVAIPATYVSETQFNTTMNGVSEAAARDALIRVDASNTLPFHFTGATSPPTFQSISPDRAWNTQPVVVIACRGSGFHPAAKATWDGTEQVTAYVSPNEITFTIDATALPTGTHQVGVTNGAGLAASNTITFTIDW